MNEGPHIDSEGLARYVAGEADAAERGTVEQWAAGAPEHQRELDAMRATWSLGAEGAVLPDVDVDAAWAKVRGRMHEIPAAARPPALRDDGKGRVIALGRRAQVVRWMAAAAMIAGLFFAVRLLFAPRAQDVVAVAEHVAATLADSSKVILSPGSAIRARMGDQRRIELSGQAYFEVKRDESHPFVVGTDDVTVTVLGTAFEVNAYDTSQTVLVRVRHGRVQVVANTDTLILEAGQHARYDRSGHFLEREAAPPMEVFGERIILFERAPLLQVMGQLEKIFSVHIELKNPALENCELTATFEDEPIDTVLKVISDTFGLRVESAGNGRYMIDGDGC